MVGRGRGGGGGGDSGLPLNGGAYLPRWRPASVVNYDQIPPSPPTPAAFSPKLSAAFMTLHFTACFCFFDTAVITYSSINWESDPGEGADTRSWQTG